MKLIQLGAGKAVFGWPLYSTWNAWVFARNVQGCRAQVLTFLSFLPMLILTTTFWILVWAPPVWLSMSQLEK